LRDDEVDFFSLILLYFLQNKHGQASMQLKSLTIFATGIVNRKETSHKTLICVRPENPVLVPFDWTTTMVWIVQEQTIVMNVTDGGTDLKSRANNSSSEVRRQAHADRQEMVL